MGRYVCVHGHFYQPPRDNPWLEVVEGQDSAAPFHDWNARITAECYRPNTVARILDAEGRLERLTNNFERISFNVGPTLLAWLAEHDRRIHDRIIEADGRSIERFGRGSAMAQVYNHAIMPLATPRDRRTQVRWGIADFRHRFGRDPEGMWLAETAADTPTLEALAAAGIRFTVLSPYQAAAVREHGHAWKDVRGGAVDPGMAYRIELPSGDDIAVFFYDGSRSQAIAFEGLLGSGDAFADRLLGGFDDDADGPRLVHVATDGESYGHHHRHGEMALAQALRRIEAEPGVELTNYAAFLDRHPPTVLARIVEPSSWSCAHGVERWRGGCDCGGAPDGTLAWRAPLRRALERLAADLEIGYEREASTVFGDPWAARDDYIEVVLDRSPEVVGRFLARHGRGGQPPEDRVRALRLLELQRHSLLMFTSCGWFFDDVARIEPVQVLRYAARALDLADELLGDGQGRRERLLRDLEEAPSSDPAAGDARRIFESQVAPQRAGRRQVAAHVAITSLFDPPPDAGRLGCFAYDRDVVVRREAGRARLAIGRIHVRSVVTEAASDVEFAVLHLGDHNLTCGLRSPGDDAASAVAIDDVCSTFGAADIAATIRTIDERFPIGPYSLADLFRDERRRVLRGVVDHTVAEVEETYRGIYRNRAPLLRYLARLGVPPPPALQGAAEVVVNADLRRAFEPPVDADRVRDLVDEAVRLGVALDHEGIAHALDATLRRAGAEAGRRLDDRSRFARFDAPERRDLERIHALLDAVDALPFEVDLARAQEVCYRVVSRHRGNLAVRAAGDDAVAQAWLDGLKGVADRLHVRMEPVPS